MPDKSERIFSYLPLIFAGRPKASVLRALIGTFGKELQEAENSLASVMQAHWVDFADRGEATRVADLAKIGALYGLEARHDEEIEAFREHLKRYVRTFLEGTVTTSGVLRVTAEALGLHVGDAPADLETWWSREGDELVTVETSSADAATLLFGRASASVTGQASMPAQLLGSKELASVLLLPQGAQLAVKTDKTPTAATIALTVADDDPSGINLDQILQRINQSGVVVAGQVEGRLALSSPTAGRAARIELLETANDAADALLGLLPSSHYGTDAQPATLRGMANLAGGIDLSDERYLRIVIDGRHYAEVDCVGANPANTSLDELTAALNAAFPWPVATHDGTHLRLASPSSGYASTVVLETPAAQDATRRLLGGVDRRAFGVDARPAVLRSRRDLAQGVALNPDARLYMAVDGESQVIACAGGDAAHTSLNELVLAINTAFGRLVAVHDGHFITVTSRDLGRQAAIVLETPKRSRERTQNASEQIFGLGSRSAAGSGARTAKLMGVRTGQEPLNVHARHYVRLAVDGDEPVDVDLWATASDRADMTPDEVVAAINQELGAAVAARAGDQVILVSLSKGAASRIDLLPVEIEMRRRHVTRAAVIDEPAQTIFGAGWASAQGAAATSAQITSSADLASSVDLSRDRFLRLTVDATAAQEIDCAGPRPRTTLPGEAAAAINSAMVALDPALAGVAAYDGKRIWLTSPSTGAASRIFVAPPQSADALALVLGVEPGIWEGRPAQGVRFVGARNIEAGVDLSQGSHLAISTNEAAPVDIEIAAQDLQRATIDEIVTSINTALEADIATDMDGHVALLLPGGSQARLHIAAAAQGDASMAILGITTPRLYHGRDPEPAAVQSAAPLPAALDLQRTRYLNLTVDGGSEVTVDLAAETADVTAVPLPKIADAINHATNVEVASICEGRLCLQSPTTGAFSRLAIRAYHGSDAFAVLFGDAQRSALGRDPQPAVLTAREPLPPDLRRRAGDLLHIAVDGGQPVKIPMQGAKADRVTAQEIVASINAVFPGLGGLDTEGRLRLTSATAGEMSEVALLPRRCLEMIEYPPAPQRHAATQELVHGSELAARNAGAVASDLELQLSTPRGTANVTLANAEINASLQVTTVLPPGAVLLLQPDTRYGVKGTVVIGGRAEELPPAQVLVGTLGAQMLLPATTRSLLYADGHRSGGIALNDPLSAWLVNLHARSEIARGQVIEVTGVDSQAQDPAGPATAGALAAVTGRLRRKGSVWQLAGDSGAVLVTLQNRPAWNPERYLGRTVRVQGKLIAVGVMAVQRMTAVFDVTLQLYGGSGLVETYTGVTLGAANENGSLAYQVAMQPSALVTAEAVDKRTFLRMRRGSNRWRFLECTSSRFDAACFGSLEAQAAPICSGRFAGGTCPHYGVFDATYFGDKKSHANAVVPAALFAPTTRPDPAVELTLTWTHHRPGTFAVNLPDDLPAQFGGRFDEARFGRSRNDAEIYSGAVFEPAHDEKYIVALVNSISSSTQAAHLVQAELVSEVPPGANIGAVPVRKPLYLAGGAAGENGKDSQRASLYLYEAGGEKRWIKLQARLPGAWGNRIALRAESAGPGRYDIAIWCEVDRFENACKLALGKRLQDPDEDLPAQTDELLRPGPFGVLQAKAAGVEASVTRSKSW